MELPSDGRPRDVVAARPNEVGYTAAMVPLTPEILAEIIPTANPALRPPPLPPEATAPPVRAEAPEPHVAQIAVLAQVLLGAAHADGFYAVTEAIAITHILARFVDLEPLPQPVRDAMRDFDHATFDLEAACRHLTVATPEDRRELLDLVSRVVDADDVVHAREGNYLRRLARAIGASPAEVGVFLAGERPPPLPTRASQLSQDDDRFDEAHLWSVDPDHGD